MSVHQQQSMFSEASWDPESVQSGPSWDPSDDDFDPSDEEDASPPQKSLTGSPQPPSIKIPRAALQQDAEVQQLRRQNKDLTARADDLESVNRTLEDRLKRDRKHQERDREEVKGREEREKRRADLLQDERRKERAEKMEAIDERDVLRSKVAMLETAAVPDTGEKSAFAEAAKVELEGKLEESTRASTRLSEQVREAEERAGKAEGRAASAEEALALCRAEAQLEAEARDEADVGLAALSREVALLKERQQHAEARERNAMEQLDKVHLDYTNAVNDINALEQQLYRLANLGAAADPSNPGILGQTPNPKP